MNRKKVESEAVESSSSEEAEEEEEDEDEEREGEEEPASESSSDDDEFDSSDERVNMVPNDTPSETLKAQEESSEDSESDEEEEPMKPATKPAESEKIQGIKSFESDVESEYESEASSESEGSMQKTVVKQSSTEPEDALPLTQKKSKKDVISVNQGIGEDDHVVKKGEAKALKQQQEPKSTKINEEANPLTAKGQQRAAKQTLKDSELSQSVKDEKKGGLSAKKRKLELVRHDGETDSANSVPVSKRRKDVEAVQNGKANVDRGKPSHTSSDTGKEIAKKTLSDSAKLNGSKDVSNKASTADHEPRQQKRASTDASNGPLSPQKQKKSPHVWSTDEEITMASEVLTHARAGAEVPSRRNDDFWLSLSDVMHQSLGVEFSREQLSEKFRRMKQRYQSTVQKIKETHDSHKPYKHKTGKEQKLFDIWSQIWGKVDVTTLEDHQAASDSQKEPSKPLAAPASFVKEAKNSTNEPKIRSASKAKASKESAAAAAENNIGRDALPSEGITTTPMELDKPEAAKEDSSVPDESALLSKDIHKLLQDKIHKTLDELQKWSKNSMEVWMSKALTLIENSVKTLGDQARRMNAMGIAGGGLPMGLCDSMEFQFMHGEQAFQQQWYELHLQELNIYSQRLELMQKECKLKQEQLKLQLQLERGK